MSHAFGTLGENVESASAASVDGHFDESVALGNEADTYLTMAGDVDRAIFGIEEQISLLQAAKTDGGHTAIGLATARVGLESTVSMFNWHSALAGNESLSTANDRVIANEELLAEAKTMLKNLWAKIKEYLTKWKNALTEFWGEHLGKAKRLVTSAEDLSKKAGEATGTPKETKLSISKSMYTNLAVQGTLSTDIPKDLGVFDTSLRNMKQTDTNTATMVEVTDALEGLTFDKVADFKTTVGKVFKSGNLLSYAEQKKEWGGQVTEESEKKGLSTDGERWAKPEQYLGNKRVFRDAVVTTVASAKYITSLKVYLGDYSKKMKTVQDTNQVTALSPSEIESIADAVAVTAKLVQEDNVDVTKRAKDVDAALKSITATVKNVEAASEDVVKEPNYKAIKKLISNSRGFVESSMQPGLAINRQALDSAVAAYQYASKSFSNLENK